MNLAVVSLLPLVSYYKLCRRRVCGCEELAMIKRYVAAGCSSRQMQIRWKEISNWEPSGHSNICKTTPSKRNVSSSPCEALKKALKGVREPE